MEKSPLEILLEKERWRWLASELRIIQSLDYRGAYDPWKRWSIQFSAGIALRVFRGEDPRIIAWKLNRTPGFVRNHVNRVISHLQKKWKIQTQFLE